MRKRATASALIVALGGAAAWAVTAQGEPVPGGQATVYRTLTETVTARYQGHGSEWWANRAVHNRRQLNHAIVGLKQARLRIRRDRLVARRHAASGLTGAIGALLCIHSGEGAWTSETANGFHGGLQMDDTFEGQYGAWARRRFGWHAGSWPPDVQILVALTAVYSGRSWYPWPRTARACGLI